MQIIQSARFNDQSVTKTDRYDRTTESLMGAKQFKLSTGLTGQAAKRAFAEYQRKAGKAGAINVASMVQQKGLLLTKLRETKTGYCATYVRPETVEVKLGRGKRTVTPEQATESLTSFSGADRMTVVASAVDLMSSADKAALLAQLTA